MSRYIFRALAQSTFLIAFLISNLSFGWAQPDTQEPSQKNRAPSVEQQTRFRDEIRAEYAELMASESASDQLDLAEQLIKRGRRSEDNPPLQYALFREALNIATDLCDPETATFVIDKLDEYFQIDYWQTVIETTELLRKEAKQDDQQRALRRMLDAFSNQAISNEEFDVAKTLIGRSIALSSSLGDDVGKELRSQLKKDVISMQSLADGAKRATETLSKNPDDSNANYAMGNYHVFVKADFKTGVSFWLKSDNAKYRKLAELETNLDSNNPVNIHDLADAWFELGDRTSGVRAYRLKQRSVFWFKKCEPDLRGTQRDHAQERINSLIAFLDEDTSGDRIADAPPMGGPASFHPDAQPAIEAALKWIVMHQLPDGGWSFDHTIGPGVFRKTSGAGDATKARNGATAMALLPLIKAGNTHKAGTYKKAVASGLDFLAKHGGRRSGRGLSYFEPVGTMYSHGMVARVFCELYAKTKDRKLAGFAQGTIWFIEDFQDPVGGGWRYAPRQPGDTSVFGWQMAALQAADASGLKINPRTGLLASKFLQSVASVDGTSFGYTTPSRSTIVDARTAIGHLGRIQLGLDKSDAKIQAAIKRLLNKGPGSAGKDAYYQYYATQLMQIQGGKDWEQWQSQTHKLLLSTQSKNQNEVGSWWLNSKDQTSAKGGRLSTTVLSTLTLME